MNLQERLLQHGHSKSREILVLTLLCIGLFFTNLGIFENDLMESRNFIAAREMVNGGSWTIPTMNGELRLEKQPFVTWLTAISSIVFNSDTNLTILRLPSAIITVCMVLFFYGLCSELNKNKGFAFFASVIFATTLLVVQMARINSWDIFTHAFMTGSIWLTVKAINKRVYSFWLWSVATLLMGLSIFSKGPVALYAMWLPFIISYSMFYNRKGVKTNGYKILMMLLMASAVGCAWYVYIYFEVPSHLSHVVNKETAAWVGRHVRPFYFYLHFPLYFGIWAIPMLAALFLVFARKRINEAGNYRFMFFWALLTFVFLSLIPEKKERYLLPIEIPLSLITSFFLHSVYNAFKKNEELRSDRILIRVHAIIMLVFLLVLVLAGLFILKNDFVQWKYILASLPLLIVAFFLILSLRNLMHAKVKSFRTIYASTVCIMLLITSLYLPVYAKYLESHDYKDVGELRQHKEYNNMEFISIGEINMQLVWRIGKTVKPVDITLYKFSRDKSIMVFSHQPLAELMSNEEIGTIDIIPVGLYSCNKTDKNCKLYANIIKKK